MPIYCNECQDCGKVWEQWQPFDSEPYDTCPETEECPNPGAGASKRIVVGVKVQGFIGTASLNPKMEQFWESGDPAVFSRP